MIVVYGLNITTPLAYLPYVRVVDTNGNLLEGNSSFSPMTITYRNFDSTNLYNEATVDEL